MWIEVIKPYVEYLGYKGTQRDIPDMEARVHVLLGNVVEVKSPRDNLDVSNKSLQAETLLADQPMVRKKRAYRRRDLKAEE